MNAEDRNTSPAAAPDGDATRVLSTPAVLPRRPPAVNRTAATLPGADSSGTPEARQVGRYLIRERLGRGGMATVYRAHDPSIGRDVAIKFLHAQLCEDAEYRGRFLSEARAAGGLSHPNIVTVYDVGEIDGRPYMAMELLEGGSLADVLVPGHTLPVHEVVMIGIQLARALYYAHSHGVVHRDIKPGNIARLQGTNTIKVMDFGIAHMDAPEGSEQRTRVGDVLGTPQYMSPEQTRGQPLDGRSDLFSVGIMFYQMLAGQRPFHGDSLVALALKIVKEEAPPLEKLRPDAPASLRRVVERCLAKAPDKRFQTGKELSEALTRVLVELDEAERNREKPRIISLRVKWAVTMGLVVAVVMAASGAVITQRQHAALMKQVTDNGASLARFIAAQNAVAALSEEWPIVDVAVQEMMKTGDFESIAVVDKAGIVRVAGNAALVDTPYRPPGGVPLGASGEGVAVKRHSVAGESVLSFEAPITFAGKPVGRVALGLAERPLQRVAQLSISLMIVQVVVTIVAVAVAMYFVANWFARPIKRVIDAMEEIGRGRFEHRIGESRKDEFGLLFAAFDRMAQALQQARESAGATMFPLTPTPATQRSGAAPPTPTPAPGVEGPAPPSPSA